MMQDVNELLEQEHDLRLTDSSIPITEGRGNAFGYGTNANESLNIANYSNNAGALFGASNARNENAILNRSGGADFFSNIGNAMSNFVGGSRSVAKSLAGAPIRGRNARNNPYGFSGVEDKFASVGEDELFDEGLIK